MFTEEILNGKLHFLCSDCIFRVVYTRENIRKRFLRFFDDFLYFSMFFYFYVAI